MGELDPDNDTRATDDALQSLIDTKRKELGIDLSKSPPKIPLRELGSVDSRLTPDFERLEKERKIREELDRREACLQRLISQCGQRYATCTLDSFVATTAKQKEAIGLVREYAAELPERIKSGCGLVLYGPVGTGKDHLAMAVGMQAIRQGFEVVHVNGQDWFGSLRDAMDDERAPSEAVLLHRLMAPAMLILSDPLPPFGPVGQHMATMIYRLIRKRYDNGKPTIVTVNVASDVEAEERLGVPTWDRLRQDAWMVYCNWASYRKPARELGQRKV